MHLSRFFLPPLLVATAVGLAACAKPVSRVPTASKAEIQQEAVYQESVAKQQKKLNPTTAYDMPDAEAIARLQPVVSRIIPAGEKLCREIYPGQPNCRFSVSLDGRKKERKVINAYANGKEIRLTPAMVAFVQNDDELALVVGHEYAHNILDHVGKNQKNIMAGSVAGMMLEVLAQSQGISTGGNLSRAGQQIGLLSYSSQFEKEADYLGMYLTRRAGYNVQKTAEFWRRMAANDPRGIYLGTTHPSTAERYVTIRKIADEIARKEAAGATLRPELAPQQ